VASSAGPGLSSTLSWDNTELAGSLPLRSEPDVWWATSGRPASSANTSARRDPLHPSWINATVYVGEPVRVFGRALGWNEVLTTCLSAAPVPVAVPSTTLSVAGISVYAPNLPTPLLPIASAISLSPPPTPFICC